MVCVRTAHVWYGIGLGLVLFGWMCAFSARFLRFFGHDMYLLGEGQGRGKAGKPSQPPRVGKVSCDTRWLAGFEAFRCVFFYAGHWLAVGARG